MVISGLMVVLWFGLDIWFVLVVGWLHLPSLDVGGFGPLYMLVVLVHRHRLVMVLAAVCRQRWFGHRVRMQRTLLGCFASGRVVIMTGWRSWLRHVVMGMIMLVPHKIPPQ